MKCPPGTWVRSERRNPTAGKLVDDGTENSKQRRNPKKAAKHSASITMSSKGVKHLQQRVEMRRRRMSKEMGCLEVEEGGRLFSMSRIIRRTSGMERSGGDGMD
ncbi:hypothetical protein EOD39_17671 [Acipenser ruthenus]|uniref:Uncharacterized protein n=1 Tax=Acipenser ruthenus TaxID=7906 RepID=A0A444V2U2_ACIRT|nr:hypothetical protein EOD39_17671 [Acipenser ruthenus]